MIAGPSNETEQEHNTRVVNYFTASGLPRSQMGQVSATTSLEQVWEAKTSKRLSNRFLGYQSVIERQIDGVRVSGSRAWASFNKNGEVVAEEVWWPPLPTSVLAEIATCRARLKDATSAQMIRAAVPKEFDSVEGVLTVHHAQAVDYAWFLIVTLDFAKPGLSQLFNVDCLGREVRFAPAGNPPSSPK